MTQQRSQVRTQCGVTCVLNQHYGAVTVDTWILSSQPPCPVFCYVSLTRLTARRSATLPYQLSHCLPLQFSFCPCFPVVPAEIPCAQKQSRLCFSPGCVLPASFLKLPAMDSCFAPFYHLKFLRCFNLLHFLSANPSSPSLELSVPTSQTQAPDPCECTGAFPL